MSLISKFHIKIQVGMIRLTQQEHVFRRKCHLMNYVVNGKVNSDITQACDRDIQCVIYDCGRH